MNLTVKNPSAVLTELQETMRIPQAKNEKFAKGVILAFDRFIEREAKQDRNNPDRMTYSSLFVYAVEDKGVTRKVAFTAKELNAITAAKDSEMNSYAEEGETIVVPGQIVVEECKDRVSQGGSTIYPWNAYPDAERKTVTEGGFNTDLWEEMLKRHEADIAARGITPTQDMIAVLKK
jgi:ribosomal protein L18E